MGNFSHKALRMWLFKTTASRIRFSRSSFPLGCRLPVAVVTLRMGCSRVIGSAPHPPVQPARQIHPQPARCPRSSTTCSSKTSLHPRGNGPGATPLSGGDGVPKQYKISFRATPSTEVSLGERAQLHGRSITTQLVDQTWGAPINQRVSAVFPLPALPATHSLPPVRQSRPLCPPSRRPPGRKAFPWL